MRSRLVAGLGVGAYMGLGLPSGALGVAWPSMRESFSQPLGALGQILVLFTVGYLVAAIAHGRIAERVSTGTFLTGSSAIGATALLLVAVVPVWPLVLVASALQGISAAGVDAELNAYVAVHHPPRVLQLMHGGFGIGATAGPVLVTGLLELGGSWRLAYVLMGSWWVVAAVAFALTRRSWVDSSTVEVRALTGGERSAAAVSSIVPDPPLTPRMRLAVVVGLGAFFFYNGLEIATGTWAFSALVADGMTNGPAALSVTAFWAALTAGRLGLGLAGHRAPPSRVLGVSMAGIPLSAALVLVGGPVAVVGLVLLGTALAGVFPALVALTPGRLGSARARRLMGVQFGSAVVGAAAVSSLVGVIAEWVGAGAIVPTLLVAAVALVSCDRFLALLDRPRPLVPSPPSP